MTDTIDFGEFKSIRTGRFDEYSMRQGLSQGNLGGLLQDPYRVGSYYSGGNSYSTGILSRRDDILIQEGSGGSRSVELYIKLLNDSHVQSAFDKFSSEITQRPWRVEPFSSSSRDEEVAQFVRMVLSRLGTNSRQGLLREQLIGNSGGYNSFTRAMCESLITGMSVGEIVWAKEGSYILPVELKPRDPRRFLLYLNEDGSVSPRLITTESPEMGIPIPMRSMIFHRFWSVAGFGDPYGHGLGRQLFQLVDFRRTMMSLWLQYADKNTTPTTVMSYPLGTPKTVVDDLEDASVAIGQDSSIVLPDNIRVSFERAAGDPSVYVNVINYIDQQISILISGENTVGQSGGGSMARDALSDSLRIRKCKAFNDALEVTINSTLVRWMVELNYGREVNPPKIVRDFSDLETREDPARFLSLLAQTKQLGYVVSDLDWIRERTGIPSLIIDPAQARSDLGGGGDTASFSEKRDETQQMTLKQIAEELGIELSVLLAGLGTSDPTKIMSIQELEKELGLQEQENFAEEDGAQEQFSKIDPGAQDQTSTKTSREIASEKIARQFLGKRVDIGFDKISTSVEDGEDFTTNLNIDVDTPNGEILYALEKALEMIQRNTNLSEQTYPEYQKMREAMQSAKEVYNSEVYRGNHISFSEDHFRDKLVELLKEVKTLEYKVQNGGKTWYDYSDIFLPYMS